jgi:hypothetical protein
VEGRRLGRYLVNIKPVLTIQPFEFRLLEILLSNNIVTEGYDDDGKGVGINGAFEENCSVHIYR